MLGKSILGAVCRAGLGLAWGLTTFGALAGSPTSDAPSVTIEQPAARAPIRTAQR